VIVPFVALQQDIRDYTRRLSLRYDIWSAREVYMAPLVLVSPETYVTKQFRDFVNRVAVRS